jgi:hypothetical protein
MFPPGTLKDTMIGNDNALAAPNAMRTERKNLIQRSLKTPDTDQKAKTAAARFDAKTAQHTPIRPAARTIGIINAVRTITRTIFL